MSVVTHYHHRGQADDLVIHHYACDDPSTGVVLLADPAGVVTSELMSEIEPIGGEQP